MQRFEYKCFLMANGMSEDEAEAECAKVFDNAPVAEAA